jgi:hypothetical protein
VETRVHLQHRVREDETLEDTTTMTPVARHLHEMYSKIMAMRFAARLEFQKMARRAAQDVPPGLSGDQCIAFLCNYVIQDLEHHHYSEDMKIELRNLLVDVRNQTRRTREEPNTGL